MTANDGGANQLVAAMNGEASLDDETIARVEAEAAERGKADFTLEAVVTDADGQTVATTRGLYQLRGVKK